MVAPLQSPRTELSSVGDDRPDVPQTGLAPHLPDEGFAEEQHPPNARHDLRSSPPPDDGYDHTIAAQRPGQASGNIMLAESSFRAADCEGVAKSCSNSLAGPFGMSEEALVRLEAGLRAQREQFLTRPPHLATAPGICPNDRDGADPAPDKISLPPTLTAVRAPDRTQHLPRAAQLPPAPGLSRADNAGYVQTPTRVPERVSSSSTTPQRRNLRLPLIILTPAVIAALIVNHFLMGGAFPAAELALVKSDVVGPARIKTIGPELPSTTTDGNAVSNKSNNDSASSQAKLESTRSISPGASVQPAVPIQSSAPPAIADQSTGPNPIMLPSGGETSSPRSRHGRKPPRAQRSQTGLPRSGTPPANL
jgi:hypothetical protein